MARSVAAAAVASVVAGLAVLSVTVGPWLERPGSDSQPEASWHVLQGSRSSDGKTAAHAIAARVTKAFTLVYLVAALVAFALAIVALVLPLRVSKLNATLHTIVGCAAVVAVSIAKASVEDPGVHIAQGWRMAVCTSIIAFIAACFDISFTGSSDRNHLHQQTNYQGAYGAGVPVRLSKPDTGFEDAKLPLASES
ncbi:Hypothetical Protein FCC1311_081742 [Hondaea fermentalgiana]|uniref:Uncharacterized protein n=1 Tax=Hondaea fermentalgiana TaxID=2315210 RepID=A0A2R5GNS1_9STRA|nr:Hypothetical Protein FCC1311_081742 [Hondaea fermentalgiana]|eukprot:GBG31949.1 Hypothetical Protein FCC1311_081742 [Hondaea fermentalgiana]